MSRRRKSASSGKKSKDGPGDEWTEEEKSSLTDALQRDDGENNWRWIARQVKTKTVTQVKEFALKLNSTKNAVNKRSATREQQADSASGKRPIAPKDDGPLEGWISATKRLRGDNDVDGTCIPQNERSRTEEDCSGKKADIPVREDSDNDNEEELQEEPVANNDLGQQRSVSPSDNCSGKKDSQMDTVMVELLTNQKQMMEKLSLLELKLDNLQSNGASSQSSLMDMLNAINNRLDQIHKSTAHGCCGGPVIIQTTPHASVVHQPILDSCSSCSGAKQDDKRKGSLPVSCGASVENIENDSISTISVSSKPVQTSLNRNSSGFHSPAILIPDSQGESLPQSQTVPVVSVAPTTCISSLLPNVVTAAESSLSGNRRGHSMAAVVSEAERIAGAASLPVGNREQLSRVETCDSVAKESSSFPTSTRSLVLVVNQSPTITSTANTRLLQLSPPSKEHKDVVSESSGAPLAASQQRFTVVPNSETRVASVQTTPSSSLQPSYIDLQSTVTSSPVLSSVARSPTTAAKLTFVGATSDSSHLPQKPTVMAKNTFYAAPLHKSSNENRSVISLHSMTTTAAQSNVPPGFISLSHAALSSTSNKIYSMSSLLPQTVRMTSQIPTVQGKELHLSPTAAAVVKKSASGANAKQTTASSKEIMNAAMLISNYVTEHPNQEQQAQWQSCLSAIVTDCHKSQNVSREEMQQLVSVGYNPYVVLTQFELEDMLEKSKGRPKFFALRLAEKLFGLDVLIKSTPYGIGGKEALHPAILDAIKVEVLRRFAADMSVEAQTALWKGCVTSIAQRCKRARNPRKNRSFRRVINDEDLGPPSMAVGGGIQHEEHEEIDSHGESDEDDDDDDDDLGSSEKPVAAKNTPPIVRIPSDDDEQESSEKGCRDVVVTTGCNKVQCVVTPPKDSTTRLESTGDTSVESNEPEGNKQDIPPGIDPNITVVHLPHSLHSSVEPRNKQVDKVTSLERQNNEVSSGNDSNMGTKPAEESATVNTDETVSVHEPQECENVGAPQENSELHGGLFQMAQSLQRLGVFPGSVTVSGIRMTPDYSHVLIGGNPNVALPRQKYLDALTRSSQPTHFAVRLAELVFGDDVLEASTVTGGKRGTLQLDPVVISAIQNEVIGRFLKDLSSDQQNVVWRKCVTSIATRCKTLRYNRSKAVENKWTLHQGQDNTEIQSDVTPQENLNS